MENILVKGTALSLMFGALVLGNSQVKAMQEDESKKGSISTKVTAPTGEQVEHALCSHLSFPSTQEERENFPSLVTRYHTSGDAKRSTFWKMIGLTLEEEAKTPEDITSIECVYASLETSYPSCIYKINFNGKNYSDVEPASTVFFTRDFAKEKEALPYVEEIEEEKPTVVAKNTEELMGTKEEQIKEYIGTLSSLYLTTEQIEASAPTMSIYSNDSPTTWKIMGLQVKENNKTVNDITGIRLLESLYGGLAAVYAIDFNSIIIDDLTATSVIVLSKKNH